MSEEEAGERVQVFRGCSTIRVTQREIRHVASEVLRQLGFQQYQLSVALLDDKGLAALNRRYLKKRRPTDVLSFDLGDDSTEILEGQVVVSAETARRHARQHRVAAKAELMLYLVHGILHLAGFDDTTASQAQRMHRREDELLAGLGYGTPFASGARRAPVRRSAQAKTRNSSGKSRQTGTRARTGSRAGRVSKE